MYRLIESEFIIIKVGHGSGKMRSSGLVNFDLAIAYHATWGPPFSRALYSLLAKCTGE